MSELKALLLTDVVGSTQMAEDLGDESMAEVWAAHDRVARELLPPWGGREIDKTDGMLLLFDGVAQALQYARAYLRALAALPVPLAARVGLHYGPVSLRRNGAEDIARGAKPLEVEGLAKPTAARIMALARGGQLLLSGQARAALGGGGAGLPSHGHWILKGVSEPLELFEGGDDDAPHAPPEDGEKAYRVVRSGERWLPVREMANNLPQQATSFIGRERELREIKDHLAQVRLLTLLGMGGLGNTRLSLQVAAELRHLFADGVWFVDLSPIRDAALVAGEAAQVLGLRVEPDRPLVQTLCEHLSTRRVLLVLDNCEHLAQAAAELAHALLRAAPGLRIVASSREALRVPGELAYPVLPLPLPERHASLPMLRRSTAVRLFVERARAHKPSFTLDERSAAAVAELVARLEGIPLALELAAARVRALGVAEINLRLRDRYKLLTGGGPALQRRQQTLRALVDWSYDLLAAAEQTALQRLGVFVGGFDLAAAEPVCGAAPLDTGEVMDLLASLVEKSLVTMDERASGTRYRMLETIREYALEKSLQAGDAPSTALRHCEHFFALAKQAREGLKGREQAQWIDRLEADLDNLRSATALALAGGADPFVAVKMAVALQGFWILRGYASEGRAVVQAALALPPVQGSDMARAHALYVGAVLACDQGDHAQARQMLLTCLELRRHLGKPVEIAATLSTLSMALRHGGDVRGAAQREREALEIFRSLGDEIGEAIGLQHLGECAVALDDDAQAQAEFEHALRIARRIGHREIEAECERWLGEIDFKRSRWVPARERFERSLAVCRDAADKRNEAIALRWLGKADLAEGRLEAACTRLAQALHAFDAFEMREELLGCLEDHAWLAQAHRQLARAARLAAALQAWRERLSLDPVPRESLRWQAWLEGLRSQLPGADFDAAWSEGARWDARATLRAALSLPDGSAPAR